MTAKPIIKFPKCFCFADKNVKTSCDGKIKRCLWYGAPIQDELEEV